MDRVNGFTSSFYLVQLRALNTRALYDRVLQTFNNTIQLRIWTDENFCGLCLSGRAHHDKEVDAMSISQSFEATDGASKYDLVAVLGGEPEVILQAISEMVA